MFFEITPAYGRDYKTAKEAKVAFESGQDFVGDHNHAWRYVNKDNFRSGDTVLLRYKKMRSVVPYKVTATATAGA